MRINPLRMYNIEVLLIKPYTEFDERTFGNSFDRINLRLTSLYFKFENKRGLLVIEFARYTRDNNTQVI